MLSLLLKSLNIFWLLPLLIIPLGVGNRLLKIFKINESSLMKLFFAYALGLAFYSYFAFFLGIFHLLYPIIIGILLLVSLIVTYSDIKYIFKQIINIRWRNYYRHLSTLAKIILFVIISIFILQFIACLAPATDCDDIAYHLVISRHYAKAHSLIPKYDDFPSVAFPQFMELLNVYGSIINNETVVRLMYFTIYLLLCCLMFYFAQTIFHYKYAIWALTIFIFTEFTAYWVQTVRVDIAMAYYLLLIIIAIFKWRESKNINWLYIVMIFSGVLLSMKITGLIFLFLNVFLIAFLAIKYNIFLTAQQICISILLLLVSGSPYYILSFINIGTIFFPFFGDGRYFNKLLNKEVVYSLYNVHLKLPGKALLPRLPKIFLLPWELTINFKKFGGFPIGPI
ncbi:hypothetical protein ACFL31_01485, partial [Candidatus Margulisiibacteriota bacterium]